MADPQTPDYMALAKQAGATDSQPPSSSPQNAGVDYMALAKQAGATDSQPASQPSITLDDVRKVSVNPQYPNAINPAFGEKLHNDPNFRQQVGSLRGQLNPGEQSELETAESDAQAKTEGGRSGLAGIATGITKEAGSTIEGLAGLANKVLPASTQIPTGPSYTPGKTPTQGISEGAGGLLENIGEFAAGDEALKSVLKGVEVLNKLPAAVRTVAEAHPTLLKVLTGATKAAIVGGTQGGVKGASQGDALAGAEGGAAGGAIGGGLAEAAGPGIKALARIFGLGGLTGEEAMVKAGRPSVGEDAQFREALDTAKSRIVEAAQDTKLKTVGDFEDLLHNTAQDIRQKEFGPMIQRNAKQMVSAQPIAQNIRAAITDQMREYAPEEAKELEDFAVKFAKDMPLGKAESDLQYFNAQLKKFYRANAIDQSAALKTSGTVAKYEAAADGLRDLIYGRLRELGENAPEELQQQYGALKQLERTFAKRATVADRQAPLNLPQVLSLVAGASEAGGALIAGHPLAAAAGVIPIAVATAAKMRNAPESLVRQGVKAFGKELAPQIGESLSSRAAKLGAGFTGVEAGRYVPVLFSNGETHEIHEEDVDKALKQNPGAKTAQ